MKTNLATGRRTAFLAAILLAAGPLSGGVAFAQTEARDSQTHREAALTNPGDPEAGERLFSSHKGLTCTSCHRITGLELSGPNLDGIGDKYSRAELIDHILQPDLAIMPGFEQAIIVTTDGRVIPGRIERATRDFVRLIDAAGKQSNIKSDQIAERRASNKSLMPDNVATTISPEQFTDLIAYLESLKFGIKSGLTQGGRTVQIPRLRKPVIFRALHSDQIRFDNPVWCGVLPGHSGQVIVVEHQTGRIWRLPRNPDGSISRREVFLDLGEEIHVSANQGLMCVAFHPDYKNNGRYFLEYEVEEEGRVLTTIAERQAAPNRLEDGGSISRRLLSVEQPAFNHNGGCIEFGPDGMLYAAFGDGGPQKDPPGHSQNPAVFLGSMIRINVDVRSAGLPYGIPDDNPDVFPAPGRGTPRPETWAIGFREPWRFSFDSATGDLWLGDVGQNKFEEVCLVRRGENHGWNVMEAYSPFSDQYRVAEQSYVEPLFAYEHGLGFSVTGGHVYRGTTATTFQGVYIFGDYNTRRVWGLRQHGGRLQDVREIGTAPGGIASFGVDEDGELLLLTYSGTLYSVDLSVTAWQ